MLIDGLSPSHYALDRIGIAHEEMDVEGRFKLIDMDGMRIDTILAKRLIEK